MSKFCFNFSSAVLLLSTVVAFTSAFTTPTVCNTDTKTSSFALLAKKNQITARNGLIYEDVEIGTGRNVFPGDTILCYYSGSYVKKGSDGGNNFFAAIGGGGGDVVTFDETKPGEPMDILIGKGAVIPGWDLGVCGDASLDIPPMKIGGDRKLTIPSGLAYGEEGAGNGVIPPNTDLLFQIAVVNADKKGGGVSAKTQLQGFGGLAAFLVFMAALGFGITQNIDKLF